MEKQDEEHIESTLASLSAKTQVHEMVLTALVAASPQARQILETLYEQIEQRAADDIATSLTPEGQSIAETGRRTYADLFIQQLSERLQK